MPTWTDQIQAVVAQVVNTIKTNGQGAITATVLSSALLAILGLFYYVAPLAGENVWPAQQTFSVAPVMSSLNGMLRGNGSAPVGLGMSGVDFIGPIPMTAAGSGTANSAVIQAAVTAACAAGGAWVLLPAGTYTVTANDISIPCFGVWITGAGNQATVLQITDGSTGALFHWSAPSGQVYGGYGGLQNLRIYRADNPSAGSAVYLDYASSVYINQVQLDGFWSNIDCYSCLNNHFSHVVMQGGNSSSDSRYLWLHKLDLTKTTSATTTSGPSLAIADTSQLHVGMGVSGTNVHAGSTIAGIVANTSITLSAAVDGTVSSGATITFTGIDTSENTATDPNWRSGVSGDGAYKYGIVGNSFDGFTLIGGHIGFTRDAAVLAQAANLTDEVDGLSCAGATLDSSLIGIYFKNTTSASNLNHHGFHNLAGCQIELMTQNALLADDTLLYSVGLGAMTVLQTQQDGIKLLAGKHWSFSGVVTGSNLANGGYSNIVINGASDVSIVGATLGKSVNAGDPSPAHHILVAGTSDNLTIGPNNYHNASGTDVSLTGSGTNINLDAGSSNRTDLVQYQPSGHRSLGVFPLDTAATSHWWLGQYDMTLVGPGRSILGNLYYSGGWKYAASGTGATFSFAPDGTHVLQCFFAPSGTGGAAATVAEWCNVDTSGNLILDFGLQVSGFTNLAGSGYLGGASANFMAFAGAAASSTPYIAAGGADTNVSLNLGTKGTGVLQINGTPGVSCGAGTVNLTTLVVTRGLVTHC